MANRNPSLSHKERINIFLTYCKTDTVWITSILRNCRDYSKYFETRNLKRLDVKKMSNNDSVVNLVEVKIVFSMCVICFKMLLDADSTQALLLQQSYCNKNAKTTQKQV